MRGTGKLVVFGAAALLSLLLSAAGVYERAEELNRQRVEAGRMRNVVLLTPEEHAPEAAPCQPSVGRPHSSSWALIQLKEATCFSREVPVSTGPQRTRISLDGSTVPKSLNQPLPSGRVGCKSVFTAIGITGTSAFSASFAPMELQPLRAKTG